LFLQANRKYYELVGEKRLGKLVSQYVGPGCRIMSLKILKKIYRSFKKLTRPLWLCSRWPPIGAIDFGDLRRLTPVSVSHGIDRGTPIDRYFIEKFLRQYCNGIKGRVLEVGDPDYTLRFGGKRVTRSDVLHVDLKKPGVTIVADLSQGDQIPSEAFDCFIMTQTLQYIFNIEAAIKTIYRILKPGGVLLATFPGICPLAHKGYLERLTEKWEDHWRFTRRSAQRIFSEIFPPQNVSVAAHGNVLAAISFLHGLAVEELRQEELDYQDANYEVLITVRAVKPENKLRLLP
jgi:SAM-dependent methyltransferase